MKKSSKAARSTAPAYFPARRSLSAFREAVEGCRACPLYRCATQAVFGEGPRRARVMFVGEQPGNDEDLSGHPFVGPAGKLFDRALAAVRIARRDAYVTNAVKHFKWRYQGKKRLHQRPSAGEMEACLPWLEEELALVKPDVLVCLGATASAALLGPSFRVTKQRGQWLDTDWAPRTLATVHPSAVLRADDREEEFERFVRDLRKVAQWLRRTDSPRATSSAPA